MVGCLAVWLFPHASSLTPPACSPHACFREFDLDGVLGRLEGLDTRNALDWVAEASLRFHWKKDVSEQTIDWRNCAVGALDRSHWVIRSAQIWAVFEDAKRDISKISLREQGWKQGRTLIYPQAGPALRKSRSGWCTLTA